MRRPPPQTSPGVPEDSQFVHEEIKALAKQTNQVIKDKFSRHATSEQQVHAGILQFGPSAQSKRMMEHEKLAAEFAMAHGVYSVWRNVDGKHANDFCSRLGPNHKCLCTHTLADHGFEPKKRQGRVAAPRCTLCGCKGFDYVPNEPEEVGEHWISRRANYVVGSWAPKCRCSHASSEHDPVSKRCRACKGCMGFDGQFACLVCDGKPEAHMTVFETESERLSDGRPVREGFFPLAGQSKELQEAVFGAQDPSKREQLEQMPIAVFGGDGTGGVQMERRSPQQRVLAGGAQPPPSASSVGGAVAASGCMQCQAPYRSATSKFCSHCGAPRQAMK